MREPRELSPWTIDLSEADDEEVFREADDEEILRTTLDLADEASSLQRRSGEVVVLLDHLLTVVGERWAPEALLRIEEWERAEMEVARG